MRITRRHALGLLGAAAQISRAQSGGIDIAKGPFEGTRKSLEAYQIPDWFRDAKFGIWAHWGPQSAPEQGDWYARRMYQHGGPVYNWHVQNFGHPSKAGFKNVVPTFKAEKFDPDHLMDLYVKAGAKYFVSMGVHHDNFDMWNSKHTKWNAANMGPKKDIVGMWRKAALARGLKFGVSEHLWITYKWFADSHRSDKTGDLAGVRYDGADPQFADLYTSVPNDFPEKWAWNGDDIPDSWRRHWFARIKDLIDNYQPDLLYTDGALPFEEIGLSLVAHHYNLNAMRHGGTTQAVYNSKNPQDCEHGTCVLDFERGVADTIAPRPWQTDTCVGDWHYKRGVKYKSPKIVIDMLVDIVSKNGNLLLNFPLPGSGELDSEELSILSEITKWMAVNSEGIYATRPWKVAQDSPTAAEAQDTKFNERNRKPLTADDIRFTSKGKTLYAFVMGFPKQTVIRSLGASSGMAIPVRNVELLGYKGKLQWNQDKESLRVQMPAKAPSDHAVTLKIT